MIYYRHKTECLLPPLKSQWHKIWTGILVTPSDFINLEFMVDDKLYTEWSEKFAKAVEEHKMWETLQQ